MSTKSHVSLIDLSKQLRFDIDESMKEKLCFAETLIVSCCHHEETEGEDLSSSDEDSCEQTEPSEDNNDESVIQEAMEVKDFVCEESEPEEIPENDFQFYFFPDCKIPEPPQGSKATLIVENGIPRLNPKALNRQGPPVCTCDKDKKQECNCFIKYPCDCGSTHAMDCPCAMHEEICICGDIPNLVCTCRESKVCLCHDHKPKPSCSCDKIQKPCICGEKSGKFPCPVCKCKSVESLKSGKKKPCDCQKAECECKKGKNCDCGEDNCFCAFKETCICGPPVPFKDGKGPLRDPSKSVCTCGESQTCICGEGPDECICFKSDDCTCGDPNDCKCKIKCECKSPCVCDAKIEKENNPCDCAEINPPNKEIKCTCRKKKEKNVLKKIRTKEGYRWCHQVDSHHTFFDYGYGMHKMIEQKDDNILQKIEITDKARSLKASALEEEEEECPLHVKNLSPFTKKVRRPCLDCCSSVGGISISVETLGEDKDKFLVQVVSHASKEGAKTGSRLVSIIDCNLHTMEENRSEHITKKGVIKEKRSYIGIGENGYYNKVTVICGEKTVSKRKYRSFEDAKDFLLEGANVVLLRYLAINRYKGKIRTETVMIDGEICESIYNSLGSSQGVVNGKPMFIVKVERHIIEPNGDVHQTLTVLSLRGYIISHEWADSCYVLHLNPLLNVIPEKDYIEPHASLREKWREDMQLFSDYLEMKSERTSDGGRYTIENGNLANVIREYLQAVLMLKPADTLHFTHHYFKSMLSCLDLPHNEYFDPCSKHVRYYFFEE